MEQSDLPKRVTVTHEQWRTNPDLVYELALGNEVEICLNDGGAIYIVRKLKPLE